MNKKELFNVSLINVGGVAEMVLPYVARVTRGVDLRHGGPSVIDKEQRRKDLELLHKIIQYNHLSVLEFSNILYQIECPIYIARQLMRYRCSSFLERSLRACGPMEGDSEAYEKALAEGMKREDARAVLPLSTKTRFLWMVNLRELLHIAEERLSPAAQPLTREIVQGMVGLAECYFPHVIEYWQETREATKCPTK